MIKHYNERFDETYYTKTLENGLQVVLWEKKNFDKSYFMMATPLGGLDLNQVDEANNTYEFPAGIAHFLEHKMFENEEADVMDLFSQMGANVNAFTSYSETAYYFSTSEDCIEPLHLLLDFVQDLQISEESVEKEKGIIIQELEMYQQMSEVRLINESLNSLYTNHPLIYDIGGDNESVSSITKQQLEECYALNYHPSKMILVGVCSLDSAVVMKEIEANQSKKQFPKCPQVVRASFDEPTEICVKEKTIVMDVGMPRVCVSYKLDKLNSAKERNLYEWCFKIIFDYYFSSLNSEYQTWLDKEIINTSFNFEIDFGDDYSLIMFYTETKQKESFVSLIKEVLKGIKGLDESTLIQLKNRYFGMSINALNSHQQIATSYMRGYFMGMDFFESIEDLESITLSDINEAFALLDTERCSIVEVSK